MGALQKQGFREKTPPGGVGNHQPIGEGSEEALVGSLSSFGCCDIHHEMGF